VLGPVVVQLQAVFLADRYQETEHRLEVSELLPPRDVAGTSTAQVLPSGPGYQRANTQQIMIALIHAARARVVLTTPYFMPDDSFQLALRMAAERGVDVRLIVSRESNKRIVQLAQQSNYDDLLEAGVKIHLYHGNFLHAKHTTVDECVALIGSSNLDIRSFALNNEVSVLIYDREVAAALGAIQARYLAAAEQVDRQHWRKRGIGIRVLQNLARLADSLI
jgi:cardiolipin synthase